MIQIFDNADKAQAYSDSIHQWLLKNRPKYNAIRWSDVNENKSDDGKFYVKIPYDYEVLNSKIILAKDKLVVSKDTMQNVEKLPVNWSAVKEIEILNR